MSAFQDETIIPRDPRSRRRKRSNAYQAETTKWVDYLWRTRGDCQSAKTGRKALTEALVETPPESAKGRPARELREHAGRQVKQYARELYGTLYGDAAAVDNPDAPGFTNMIHEALASTPEFQRLAENVYGDADFAALATADVMAEMAPQLEKAREQEQEEQKRRENGESNRRRGPSPQETMQAAARAAAKKAGDKNAQVKAAMAGIAPGIERAPNLKDQREDDSRMMLAQVLRDDDFVRKVIRRAGRIMRGVGRESRKSAGREEVVDIERGADIARLLPSELALLADPDLEMLTMRAIVEESALQYQLEGNHPIGRGPMVVLVDRSSSMGGAPFEIACGVTIALAMVACRERRKISVIFFDTMTHPAIRMHSPTPRALAGLCRELRQVRARGGTNFNTAFKAGMRELEELPRADLVFVTDSQGESIRGRVRTDLDERKVRDGLRVWGVTVNHGQVTQAVKEVCEQVISLDASDPEKSAMQLIAGAAR